VVLPGVSCATAAGEADSIPALRDRRVDPDASSTLRRHESWAPAGASRCGDQRGQPSACGTEEALCKRARKSRTSRGFEHGELAARSRTEVKQPSRDRGERERMRALDPRAARRTWAKRGSSRDRIVQDASGRGPRSLRRVRVVHGPALSRAASGRISTEVIADVIEDVAVRGAIERGVHLYARPAPNAHPVWRIPSNCRLVLVNLS
jgi:hypothetical protein